MGKWVSVCHLFSRPYHTRGLKFGRNNHHIGGSKFTNRIFYILSRSWDISVQSSVVNLATPTFFTLSFIAENSSLLLVVQSNQWIEHVSSRSGGLGIFPRTKNTHLPGLLCNPTLKNSLDRHNQNGFQSKIAWFNVAGQDGFHAILACNFCVFIDPRNRNDKVK